VSAVVSGALDRTRAEPASTERSFARGFPLVVWLLVGLQTTLMLCFTVLYPPFQAPDEVPHIDYVLAHRHGEWFDGVGERRLQLGVLKAFNSVPQTQSGTHVGGQAPTPRSTRKSFDALGSGPSDSLFPNQMVQHPPLYYGLAAGFSYLLPGFSHHRFDVQVFWLRLFSVLLMAPVPLLIYAAARRATRNTTIALVAAIIPLSIPTYLRAGASVTNDSLLTVLTVAMAALLVRVAWGDRTRRTAVLLGLVWGCALLTKGFALALPPAIVLAYLVGANGSLRARLRASWTGIVTSGAIGFALGGWWWIRNLVVYGQVQPNGFANLPDSVRQQGFGRDRPHGSELDFFNNFFRLLGQRVWGSLGLTDLPSLPHSLLFTAAALLVVSLVVAVLAGLPRLRTRVELPGWTVGRAVSLILPTLLTLVVIYLNARSNYMQNHPLGGVQSRYFIPNLLGLAICAAVALYLAAGRWRRWLPVAALLATLLFILASVYEVISVEMSSAGPDRVRRLKDAVRFVVGWAPFPPAVTAMMLAVTVGLAATTVVVLMRATTRVAPDEVAVPVRSAVG
jgi:4-amino-4-deoxy-L-arabinose transferase-like glycosyltransferase